MFAPTTATAWEGPLCALEGPISQPHSVVPELAPAEPPMCTLDDAPGHFPVAGDIDDDTARRALARARQLAADGSPVQALIALDLVDEAFPLIADRTALMRGDLFLAAGRADDAEDAFESALDSPDSTVRARARVGRVRSLIQAGDRHASSELASLMRRYPEMGEALHLRYELAQAKEAADDVQGAIRIYRSIDLMHPGSPVAAEARQRLAALADAGVVVRGLTTLQQVDRAERLAQQGPMDMARVETTRLLAERLPVDMRKRVAMAAARIARIDGRWDDARRYLNVARTGEAPDDVSQEELRERAMDVANAATAREQEQAQDLVDRLRRRRPWARVPHLQLRNIIDIAARAGLEDTVNEALRVLAAGRNVHPQLKFDAAILAAGTGDDELVAELFSDLVRHPRLGVESRYHRARALERLGRWVDAERELIAVIDRDRSETRYYRMWAEQRLWSVREAMVCDCGPEEIEERRRARRQLREAAADEAVPVVLASLDALADPMAGERPDGLAEGKVAEGEIPPLRPDQRPDLDALRVRLEPIAEEHGEVFPWLPRAVELLRLHEDKAASDELHEAYLAWRDARGRGIRRVGLEAVFRGAERPRERVTWQERRDRQRLDADERRTLGEIASALGDEGTAAGFIGWERVRERPRAFEPIVREVAARHGLDPNLLLAVMRVESVYQPRIVSYAGAVGLMQIMPRTGRLIAEAMGRDDFTTADLLDPETNLEFAAWYLASLIDRWDGHLPLAIASYNGGPHNVRRWLRDHAEDMPLDAFLERIPFTQTHRYVRRVLTHYEAYRQQQGLPMQRLSVALPQPSEDPVGF